MTRRIRVCMLLPQSHQVVELHNTNLQFLTLRTRKRENNGPSQRSPWLSCPQQQPTTSKPPSEAHPHPKPQVTQEPKPADSTHRPQPAADSPSRLGRRKGDTRHCRASERFSRSPARTGSFSGLFRALPGASPNMSSKCHFFSAKGLGLSEPNHSKGWECAPLAWLTAHRAF